MYILMRVELACFSWCEIAQCLLRCRLPLCVAAGCGHGGLLGCDAHHVQHIAAGAGGTGGFPLLCALVSEGASPHVCVASVWLSAVAGPCDKVHQASQWWQGLLAAVLVCACGPVAHLVVAGAAVCPVVLLLCRWPPRQLSQAAQWWQLLMCALLGLLGTGNGA